MRRLPDLCAALLLCAASAAAAEAPWRLDRAAELPAHRALAAARAASGDALAPFETDGCSGGMSAVWGFAAQRFPAFAAAQGGRPPWEACCVAHDRLYHRASDDPDPQASFAARLAADEALRACVAEALGEAAFGLPPDLAPAAAAATADAMFLAVRLGGGPCTGLPWRWGYGRAPCGPFGGEL
ncbi:MAG: hypothetical protein ACFCUS_13410 [Rubrimonas sp.]|uniref:hypothetical protein n=1 Tax=Rubrimonas sp. TaxID=2036015 RepID=UPI002FDC88DC